jgi:hypothetical protein
MKATQPIIELFYVDTRQIYWSPLFASSMVVMMGDIIWNLLFTLNGPLAANNGHGLKLSNNSLDGDVGNFIPLREEKGVPAMS